MAAVDEDSKLHSGRAAELEERVDRSANGAARVQDVVDEDDGLALERERDARRADDGLTRRRAGRRATSSADVHVVAVEGDVEGSELELAPTSLCDEAPKARGERDSAGLDANERDLFETVASSRARIHTCRALDDLVSDAREGLRDRLGVENLRLGAISVRKPSFWPSFGGSLRPGWRDHRAPFRSLWTGFKGCGSLARARDDKPCVVPCTFSTHLHRACILERWHAVLVRGRILEGSLPRPSALGPAVLGLAVLVLVSTVFRFVLSREVAAPWIAPDEPLYGLLGRSLVAGDGLTVLGEAMPYYSLLYPLLVGLPFIGSDVAGAVTGVQLLQALLMSATAIPVFLWARPLAGARWALLAAALTVLIPGLVYSSLLMSEALYYPVATLAVWALACCLVKPTWTRQVLLLGAIGLALATRLQAVGFVAVIVLALAFLALSERSTAPFRRMWPTLAALGALAVGWIATRVAVGGVGELLGAYAPLGEAGSYSVSDVARSIAWHTGSLALLTVAVPLVALGVLAWHALQGNETDLRARALVAAAVAYLAVTVVEVSAFASRFVDHVTERQLLSVAPPVFVAFAVWLSRGLPRSQPATSIIAIAVAAPTLLLPLDRVATPATAPDAPSMIVLEQLRSALDSSTFEALYAGAAALLLALAVLLPRRLAPLLAALVAAVFLVSSLVASREFADRSQVERERTFAGMQTDWIDASGATDATLLLTGDRFWPSAWHELFWNDSVTEVARVHGAESPGLLPEAVVSPLPDGRLQTSTGELLDPPYLAAPAGVAVVGERIAQLAGAEDQPGIALWRTEQPVRLSQRVVGFRPNGDLHGGESARIRVFACGPGRLELTLLGKEGLATRVLVDRAIVAERAIPAEGVWRPSVASPASANGTETCIFRVETDGLVGSTTIHWRPAPAS